MSRMSRANGITRQEILTSIKCNGAMTADELSQELNISQVAVRQHLASLEAEDIIAVSVERRGLGRPSHRYRLTPHGDETFPRRYDLLADEILEELRSWQGDEAVATLFARQRERRQSGLQARVKDKPLTSRVNELARFQTDSGYMAEVQDPGDGTLLLVEHNCAVCAVARNHPDICCGTELDMFQQVLGDVEVVREKYIQDGDHTCTYRIRPTGSKAAK